MEMARNGLGYRKALEDLHHDKALWMKLKIFVYDMLHFSDAAQNRLIEGLANYCFGQRLLSFPTPNGLSLLQSLELRMESKRSALAANESSDAAICTSHDLAPLLLNVFGIRRGFAEEKIFVNAHKEFENN